jgi:hypothetical protein
LSAGFCVDSAGAEAPVARKINENNSLNFIVHSLLA